MITKIDFKNSKRCDCCHTKIATKLCDYIVDTGMRLLYAVVIPITNLLIRIDTKRVI